MAINVNWPLVVTQVAFNAGVNTAVTPTWTDLTPRMWSLGCDRGRQYELDLNQAGTGQLVLADRDEGLNPTNPGSPFYPNVLPYRPILVQAMWPPTPVGGAVNLINAVSGYDPTFESYAVGQTLRWANPVGGTTVTVSSTAPFSAPNCVGTSTLVVGTTVQGLALGPFATIPGQVYTFRAQVRPGGAFTVGVSVQGGPAGTTTSAAGAYAPLAVTFTATQPAHTILVQSSGTVTANTIKVDNIQLEPGGSASTFSTTGPTIYGVHRGYVERWPSTWNHQGMYGYTQIDTVDTFAALATSKLHTEYRNSVLAKQPAFYWPLQEPDGTATFAETSGNVAVPLQRIDSKYGPATTFTPGTQTGIPGDNSGVGVLIDGPFTSPNPATALQAGATGTVPFSIAGGLPSTVTAAVWFTHGPTIAGQNGSWLNITNPASGNTLLSVSEAPSFGTVISSSRINRGPVGAAVTTAASVTDTWQDSRPHLLVTTTTVTAAGITTTLWVDGQQVATDSAAATISFFFSQPGTMVQIGGYVDASGAGTAGLVQGTYAHLALWSRALTAGEIADLWAAGRGYPGEGSGARIARLLSYSYAGTSALDAGQSTMGVSDLAEGTLALDAVQAVALSENGNLWCDGAGTLTFFSRSRRYLATTSMWTLGENALPYEGDIAYDFDPQLIYNSVEVTNSGGATAAVQDTASQVNYGPRDYQRTINVASDYEAIDAADWILATHKNPHQRIATITIKPSANPALWPIALGAEIGDRVTVRRTTTAGYTMQADYFIEQISHSQGPDAWTVQFQMSPAFPTQAWILGDAVLGVLDTSTILAY